MAASLLCPWDSPDKNTEVSSHSLLQSIFLTQGLNLGLPHCRQILCCMSHQGSFVKLKKKKVYESYFQKDVWNGEEG